MGTGRIEAGERRVGGLDRRDQVGEDASVLVTACAGAQDGAHLFPGARRALRAAAGGPSRAVSGDIGCGEDLAEPGTERREPTGPTPAGASADAPRQPAAGLALRFLLEVALLAALGVWGWRLGGSGVASWALAIGLPLGAVALWVTFNVPGDPSRGGGAPVPVRGAVRLGVEWGLFGLAAYDLWSTDSRAAAETLLTAAAIHYALAWDRLVWLLRW